MSTYLGLDLGTGGVRAVVADGQGRVLGEGGAPHPTAIPHPQESEQDPEDWWRAARRAVRQALQRCPPAGVRALGLSGQMCTTVLLDEGDRPVRPALLWNDERSASQGPALEACAGGKAALLARTGNRPLPAFSASKLLWLREHEPTTLERTRRLLLPKDFLRLRLTGDAVTDLSDASGTLLLDLGAERWCERLAESVGLPLAALPPCVPSVRLTGTLRAEAARDLGLAPGLPVAAGAGDSICAGVSAGAVRPGSLAMSLGTSGILFAPSARFRYDPEGRVVVQHHALPGLWCLMGVLLSAGACLQWLASTFARRTGYDRLTAEAASVPPGAEGLVFLPHLSGASTPHADPAARGCFAGLTPSHTRGHLVRAVLEGVAFAFRDCLDAFRALDVPVHALSATGGGARSPVWRQVLADTLGLPVSPLEADQGPAFGAAILAAVAVGDFEDLEGACAAMVRHVDPVDPHAEGVRAAEEGLALYRDLHRRLEGFRPG